MLGAVGKLRDRIGARRHARSDAAKVGLAPGTLIHIGQEREGPVEVRLTHFQPDTGLEERTVATPAELREYRDRPGVTWIDVTGVHDLDLVADIGEVFGLHPLLLEDVVHTRQRPKTEEYDDHLYLVLKMLRWDEGGERVDVEQVSVILGERYVITFQENPVDTFDKVRARLREPTKRIRKSGADYLAYALVDSIVDHYFAVLEVVGDRIEDIEDELIEDPDEKALTDIFRLKRTLVYLRRAVWPLRDAVGSLLRGEIRFVRKATLPFLRDVNDHTLRAVELIETYRDMVSGMVDIYMSSVSNRMNEVMRVLTVIATIFIPLTFIAGVYGMNFDRMPELHWDWGYYAIWGVMAAVAVALLLYFRRRGWL